MCEGCVRDVGGMCGEGVRKTRVETGVVVMMGPLSASVVPGERLLLRACLRLAGTAAAVFRRSSVSCAA